MHPGIPIQPGAPGGPIHPGGPGGPGIGGAGGGGGGGQHIIGGGGGGGGGAAQHAGAHTGAQLTGQGNPHGLGLRFTTAVMKKQQYI